MAKAGFWLRGATGKLAGSALQKGADGSTIIREIVQPTNPKTENQKIQRIIMTTVMQAYSQMKAITDHSFEGVTAGAATMSMFMKYNLNMLRQKVATGVEQGEDIETMYHFCPTGAKIFAPNDYIISQGTLPGIGVVYANAIPGAAVASAFAGIELPQNTYRSLIDAYGLRRGDQITLISVQGNNQAQTKFYFARIILDPTNADGTQASLDSPLVADGAVNLPSPRNEGEFAGLIYNEGKLFYSFVTNQSVSTAGVIVSRKSDNGKWLRSACTLKMREDTILIDGFSLGYCLSNFSATEIGTLSNRMLNNAGQGHVVQDGGASPVITTFVLNGKSLAKGGTIDVQVAQNARVPLFIQAANLDPNAQYRVYGMDEYDTPMGIGGLLVNGMLQVNIEAIAVQTGSYPIKLVKGSNVDYEVIEDYGTVNWTRTE